MSKTYLESLTSVGKNLQSGVDQLKETKVDETKRDYVLPEDFYNDTDVDYTNAFVKAIAYCKSNNKELKAMYKKEYTVSSTLNIDFGIRADFNNATIKAVAEIDAIIKFSNSSARISRVDMRNLNLDGNANANYCLYIADLTDSLFDNIYPINSIIGEVIVTKTTFQTNQSTLRHFRMRRDTILSGTENCIALIVNEQDFEFNDIVSVNYKTHIDSRSGVSWYNCCHGWNTVSVVSAFFTDTVFMNVSSESILTNCNCSGMATAYSISGYPQLRLNYTNAIMGYVNADSDVTTIFKIAEGSSPYIKCSGCYLEGNSETKSVLTNIDPDASSSIFVFDGTNNIKKMNLPTYFVDGKRQYNKTKLTNVASDVTLTMFNSLVTYNHVVTIDLGISVGSVTANQSKTLFTLPAGIRPSHITYCNFWLLDGSTYKEQVPVTIKSDGVVSILPLITTSTNTNIRGAISYSRIQI